MPYRMGPRDSARPLPQRSWGYAIDYDKEIAEDERELALVDGPVARAVSASLDDVELGHLRAGYVYDRCMWLWYKPQLLAERAAVLGLSEDDLAALALHVEDEYASQTEKAPDWVAAYAARIHDRWSSPEARAAWAAAWRRGQAIRETLSEPALAEDRRKAYASKVKAQLARHRRNKIKYA